MYHDIDLAGQAFDQCGSAKNFPSLRAILVFTPGTEGALKRVPWMVVLTETVAA